jgi:hypothetical protein
MDEWHEAISMFMEMDRQCKIFYGTEVHSESIQICERIIACQLLLKMDNEARVNLPKYRELLSAMVGTSEFKKYKARLQWFERRLAQ